MSPWAAIRSIGGEGGIMSNYDFGPIGGSAAQSPYHEPENDSHHKNSIFSLIVMIVIVAVIGAVALSVAFWVIGILFHLAGWILRIAVLAAVAAFVWRKVSHRWSRDHL
jgi:hypothetical protein